MPLARTSASRPTTRSLTRRVVGVLAATGLATTLGWAAVAVPVAQADDPGSVNVTNVVTKSRYAEAWSEFSINADWDADHPRAGQTLTVDLGEGLQWASGVDFKLVKKDDESVTLGDCTAVINSQHLTCTLNDTVQQWDHVVGTLSARSQITPALIGKKESTVVANGKTFKVVPGDSDGDGVCDTDHCDGVVPEQARKTTVKTGWMSDLKDGTYTWTWTVNVYGATSYTVVDPEGTYSKVECTNSDWSDSQKWRVTDVKNDKDSHTISWSVDSSETVCRVFYTSTSSADSKDNTATVNGEDLTATATARTVGRGDGDGTNDEPTPTPSASSTPPVVPSEPVPTTAPTPSQQPPSPPSSSSNNGGSSNGGSNDSSSHGRDRNAVGDAVAPEGPVLPEVPIDEGQPAGGADAAAPGDNDQNAPAADNPAPEQPAAPVDAGEHVAATTDAAAAAPAPEPKKPALAHTGAAAGVTGLVAVAALAAGGLGLKLSRRRA